MNKIITMSDSTYFKHGKDFLESLCNVNAQCILYGPDLTEDQITLLDFYNVRYEYIDSGLFYSQMQKLKFKFMLDQIRDKNGFGEYQGDGITFCDFDTFFLGDWGGIFNEGFDLGITVRFGDKLIKNRCLRAYANGGVIFCKDTEESAKALEFALYVINKGRHILLNEYDRIWHTLEYGRTPEKTKYRTEHKWWVDQVFLSACCLQLFERFGYDCMGGKVAGSLMRLFDCKEYNRLDAVPNVDINAYIGHKKVGAEP